MATKVVQCDDKREGDALMANYLAVALMEAGVISGGQN